MKKIIFLMTMGLLLSGCAAPAQDAPPPGESAPASSSAAVSTPEESGEEFPNPGGQQMASDACSAIMASFGSKQFPGDPAYPSYPAEFSGAYIEDNFLYVCLTDTSEPMREKYRSLVVEPSILCFVEVEYSYNDLYALQMALVEVGGLEFSCIGIDVMNNEVDIGIPDITKEEADRKLIEENLPAEILERFETLPITFEEQAYASFT